MYKFKLLYYGFLLLTIRADCYSFDDYQANTGVILDLLKNEDSNKHLINTVVDCMGKTFTSNGKSNDFLRCVNDLMHTDDLTNTDDIRYIIGNYASRSSKLLVKCYLKKNDLIYCLRAFGDCLPLLFRGLHGYDVHNRGCRRLINLPKYDKTDDYYRDEEDDMYDEDEYDTYDDYDDYDEDEYDYDEDEYDGDEETDDEDIDGMITDRTKVRRRRRSSISKSQEPAASSESPKNSIPSPSQAKGVNHKASDSGDSVEVISDHEDQGVTSDVPFEDSTVQKITKN